MEKNRIRPVKSGKAMRMSFSRQKEVLEMPNLIEVQKDSYQWFLNEGLKEPSVVAFGERSLTTSLQLQITTEGSVLNSLILHYAKRRESTL